MSASGDELHPDLKQRKSHPACANTASNWLLTSNARTLAVLDAPCRRRAIQSEAPCLRCVRRPVRPSRRPRSGPPDSGWWAEHPFGTPRPPLPPAGECAHRPGPLTPFASNAPCSQVAGFPTRHRPRVASGAVRIDNHHAGRVVIIVVRDGTNLSFLSPNFVRPPAFRALCVGKIQSISDFSTII